MSLRAPRSWSCQSKSKRSLQKLILLLHGGQRDFLGFLGPRPEMFPSGPNNPMAPNWRRSSPSFHHMLPHVSGLRPHLAPLPGESHELDMREPKRPRYDASPADVVSHSRRGNHVDAGEPFGFAYPDRDGVSQTQHSHVVQSHGPVHGSSDKGCSWRGIIAKCGNPLCRARCVPIGKGIETQFPEIINYLAKARYENLTKHCREAVGFDLVYFLPDSEDEFGAYTRLWRDLRDKGYAGVATFDDGTELFLVPPSNFLSHFLNVHGPERLYGVVFKMPQKPATSASQLPHLGTSPALSHNNEWLHVPDKQGFASKPAASPQVEESLRPKLLSSLASLTPHNIPQCSSGQDAVGTCNPSVQSGPNNSSILVQTEAQSLLPQIGTTDQVNCGSQTQGQNSQVALSNNCDGPSEDDADKNLRDQQILQFAAYLLLQVQQKGQESDQAAERPANNQ